MTSIVFLFSIGFDDKILFVVFIQIYMKFLTFKLTNPL